MVSDRHMVQGGHRAQGNETWLACSLMHHFVHVNLESSVSSIISSSLNGIFAFLGNRSSIPMILYFCEN